MRLVPFFIGTASAASPISEVMRLLTTMLKNTRVTMQKDQVAYMKQKTSCAHKIPELQNILDETRQNLADAEAAQEAGQSKFEKFGAAIMKFTQDKSDAENDLDVATKAREKQAAAFAKAKADLSSTLDALERAITIVKQGQSRQDAGQSAPALMQMESHTDRTQSVMDALSLVLSATRVNLAGKSKLVELLAQPQATQVVFESKSGGIIKLMKDMESDTAKQKSELIKDETAAKNAYAQTKQSLLNQIKSLEKDITQARKDKETASEAKATAAGLISKSQATIVKTNKNMEDTRKGCMNTAQEYEKTFNEDKQEIAALQSAIKIIGDTTGAAADREYSEAPSAAPAASAAPAPAKVESATSMASTASEEEATVSAEPTSEEAAKPTPEAETAAPVFIQEDDELASNYGDLNLPEDSAYAAVGNSLLQVNRHIKHMVSNANDGDGVVPMLRDLGFDGLALRLQTAFAQQEEGVNTKGVFDKVKTMINNMIKKLTKAHTEAATKASWCQEEKTETSDKRETIAAKIENLVTRQNKYDSLIETLKEKMETLQDNIKNLLSEMKEADSQREEQRANFLEKEKDYKMGLEGLSQAVTTLREHFGDDANGNAQAVFSQLEVAETDFSKSLTETTTLESEQKSAYDKTKQDSEVQMADFKKLKKRKKSSTEVEF